jgi:hypothetical protein
MNIRDFIIITTISLVLFGILYNIYYIYKTFKIQGITEGFILIIITFVSYGLGLTITHFIFN